MTAGLIKKIEFIGITVCYQTNKKGDVREPSSETPTCDISASVYCLYILNIYLLFLKVVFLYNVLIPVMSNVSFLFCQLELWRAAVRNPHYR